MNNKNELRNTYYDFLKCIWMASNVVEYKLCDRNFDCENCQFDKVMRNFPNENHVSNYEQQNILNSLLNKLKNIHFDDKIIYLKNCLIAKQIFPNTYYLGINPILISFLDNVSMMMEYKPSEIISNGENIIQFLGEWGEVSLSAPMNFSIYDRVNNPADDPMRSKWIAIIGAIQQEISGGKLSEDNWNSLQQKSFEIVREIKSSYPKVGLTMQDGGSQINYLHQLVGKEKYINILKSLSL